MKFTFQFNILSSYEILKSIFFPSEPLESKDRGKCFAPRLFAGRLPASPMPIPYWPAANFLTYVACKLIQVQNISANILYLVGKVSDFEMSSLECNNFENLQFRYHKRPFVWQVPASPMPIPYWRGR